MHHEDTVPIRTDVPVSGHEFEYAFAIQLRYSYRLDPWPRHRLALGKAFGCARVVFNDALAMREAAYQAGEPYTTDSDAGWSSFVATLEYKARLYGREFHRIGRFTPTSQTCSACEVKDGPKPLHVRKWRCGACRAWLDRDINAAVNVARAAGLAVTACGAQVRPESVPAQRGEAGTHPKSRQEAARQAGIPAREGRVEVKCSTTRPRPTSPTNRLSDPRNLAAGPAVTA